jgi:putative ABC transport system substrate-binding protein
LRLYPSGSLGSWVHEDNDARAHAARRRAHESRHRRRGSASPFRRIPTGTSGIQFGWSIGRNLRVETRFTVDNSQIPRYAAELVALEPDVILANSNTAVLPLQQVNRRVPIVFTASTDPVGVGLVESLARPGGNATGFISAEFGMSAKWLELLKEVASGVTRAAVLLEPSNIGTLPQFAAVQTVARRSGWN